MDKVKKICLLSDHHICFNPRLWKEAFFYEKKGFEVVILSMWLQEDFLQKDLEMLRGHSITYKSYLNLIPGEINKSKYIFYRVRKRLAGDLQRIFKVGTRWAISYAPELMTKCAMKENADLYAAHLECAFLAGRYLIKAGKKVSFDFEDWYSRDFLVPERPVKLLEASEKFALENGVFCTAASEAMVTGVKKYFKKDYEISVIYNGFSENEEKVIRENKAEDFGNSLQLLWFSRSVGPERGIELLLNALSMYNSPVELHLLGKMEPGYQSILDEKFIRLKRHKLFIHPFVPHDKLLSFISRYEIGLAIDENINENRKLTITNKILQYIQAGMHVLASNTAGHREVAKYFPQQITIVDINNPEKVTSALDILKNEKKFRNNEERDTFHKIFSWEAQEKKLEQLIQRI